jgi:hypothetical protein
MLVLAQALACPPSPSPFVISRRVHVFQDQPARIDPSPLTRVNKIHAKLLDGVRNFSHPARKCSGNRPAAFAAVHRGQRLDPALGSWNDSFTARTRCARKQPLEPFCRKIRQIAGDDQIPARVRCSQSGDDSCERSTAESVRSAPGLHVVGYRAQPEFRVSAGRSDNCDFGDEWFEQSSCMQDQRNAAEIEKPLVAAHARAGASRKNEPSDLAIAFHECPAILRPRAELAQRSGGL